MRHVLDIWPVGLEAAKLNKTPILIFIFLSMMFAGAIYRLGGGTITILALWLAGAYAASIVMVAAIRTAASRGEVSGMLALGPSSALHKVAGRLMLIGFCGIVLATTALALGFGAPQIEAAEPGAEIGALRRAADALLAAAGPVAVGVAASLATSFGVQLFGPGMVSASAQDLDAPQDTGAIDIGPGRMLQALLIGPTPVLGVAVGLNAYFPSAETAGGYWTAAHAFGEFIVFALVGVALAMTGVALEAARAAPKPADERS